jgi:hypothetical protein
MLWLKLPIVVHVIISDQLLDSEVVKEVGVYNDNSFFRNVSVVKGLIFKNCNTNFAFQTTRYKLLYLNGLIDVISIEELPGINSYC